MRKSFTTILTLTLGAVLTGTLAAPAQAANSDVYPRVRAVDTSENYVIYKQKTTTHGGLLFSRGDVKLYYVGKDKKRHALAGFNPDKQFNLARNNVTQPLGADRQAVDFIGDATYVHWSNLTEGSQGTTALTAGDTYLAATPNGWLTSRATDKTGTAGNPVTTIIRNRNTGGQTDLGIPFADGTDYYAQAGSGGVLAYSINRGDNGSAGAIRYQPYSTPGKWRTVFNSHQAIDITCTAPSTTRVACEIDSYYKAPHAGWGSFSLTGGTTRWVDNHRTACNTSNYVAFGNSIVALASTTQQACKLGHLYRLGSDDKLAVSKATYNTQSNTRAGLGKIILSSKSDRSLISLTGVTKKPQQVVTAH